MKWKLTIVYYFDQGDGFKEQEEVYEDTSLVGLIVPFLNAIYDGAIVLSIHIEQEK